MHSLFLNWPVCISPGKTSLKKAEGQKKKNDAFELWCWRRLLRIPWTAQRPNQSILKEINPEYSLEGHAEAEAPRLWPPDEKG